MSGVNGLEAVADGIMQFEGWTHVQNGQPSMSYRNRNPGNLEAIVQGGMIKRVFPDLISGYSALLVELKAKFSGNNAHGIGPSSTLLDLFNVYAPGQDGNDPNGYCSFVARWCTIALGTSVTPQTQLSQIWSQAQS